MQQPTEFKTFGVKKSYNLQIKLDREQQARLKALASASGYKSVSDYVRTSLLNPSVESKLNTILQLLQSNKAKKESSA